jgi:ERF superfamily
MPGDRMSVEAFAKALADFQAEIPTVGKDQTAKVPTKAGGSYSYSFADLTTITDKALPLLAKHGLSFSAFPTMHEVHGFVLEYELLHIEGFGRKGFYPLPDPVRSSPQEIGSGITYGRRYTLCAATGIAPGGEDDDGQTATNAHAAPRAERDRADALLEAKSRVWTAAQKLGWDRGDVAINYSKDHDDAAIGLATPDVLHAWAVELEKDLLVGAS